MLIVFTGNGKGKTSAALGTALRSLGWRRNVAIIQFIKGNKEIGEWRAIKNLRTKIESDFDIFQFFDDKKLSITEKEITITKSKEYKESCKKAWEFTKELIQKRCYDLIILDEINNTLNYNLINKEDFFDFIQKNSNLICSDSKIDIIFTGRDAPKKLIDLADTVTEMKEIKHYFQKGFGAKRGIDY